MLTLFTNPRACSWEDPSGNRYTIPRKGLTADGGRLRYYEGKASECGIVISSIKESDKGDWTCSVTVVQGGEVTTETAVAQVIVWCYFAQAPGRYYSVT